MNLSVFCKYKKRKKLFSGAARGAAVVVKVAHLTQKKLDNIRWLRYSTVSLSD
jgi:hypothetical protein